VFGYVTVHVLTASCSQCTFWQSLYVCVSSLASSILGTAVVVASKAASAALSTAKDVYYTLQARNEVPMHLLNTHTHPFYSPVDFVWDYPGEPVPEPIWILLKQETVSGTGISWAIRKSAPRPRQIPRQHPTTHFFTGQMPFLPPHQQHQSTECIMHLLKVAKNIAKKLWVCNVVHIVRKLSHVHRHAK